MTPQPKFYADLNPSVKSQSTRSRSFRVSWWFQLAEEYLEPLTHAKSHEEENTKNTHLEPPQDLCISQAENKPAAITRVIAQLDRDFREGCPDLQAKRSISRDKCLAALCPDL
jgi:hypothetical protein